MKEFTVNPSHYEKIKNFQNMLSQHGITVIAKNRDGLILEVQESDLEEVLKRAVTSKIDLSKV